MIAFCILLFIVLVVGSQHAKKQAAKNKYVPPRQKAVPAVATEPKPDMVTLSVVERHFGVT